MTQNRIVIALGVKGQGKSYSIKRSLDKLRRHVPVYVWDPNREYAGDAAKDGIRDALVYRNWEAFLTAASAQEGHLGRTVIQVAPERFAAFCSFVHRCGGCTVVLDELHDYVGPTAAHRGENEAAFKRLLTTSRHRRIDCFLAAWRPTDLPPWTRHCADEVRAFNTNETNDLKWYQAACGEDFACKLPGLAPRVSSVWVRGRVARDKKPKP